MMCLNDFVHVIDDAKATVDSFDPLRIEAVNNNADVSDLLNAFQRHCSSLVRWAFDNVYNKAMDVDDDLFCSRMNDSTLAFYVPGSWHFSVSTNTGSTVDLRQSLTSVGVSDYDNIDHVVLENYQQWMDTVVCPPSRRVELLFFSSLYLWTRLFREEWAHKLTNMDATPTDVSSLDELTRLFEIFADSSTNNVGEVSASMLHEVVLHPYVEELFSQDNFTGLLDFIQAAVQSVVD